MEELKLETVNLKEIEIFSTGIWKGKDYNEKDIDDFVKNFKEGVAEPYITIDHSDKASAQFKDALQALALGFVEKLLPMASSIKMCCKVLPFMEPMAYPKLIRFQISLICIRATYR